MTYDHKMIYRIWDFNTDSDVVHNFFEEVLSGYVAPYPADRSVVVLDNAHYHGDYAREPLVRRGVIVAPLPPYSPDFNPIELAFQVCQYNGIDLLRAHSSFCFHRC
jgi:transposase